MTLMEKMQEAAQRAAVISVDDDICITIRVRNYGFLIQGQSEVGEKIKRISMQLLWEQVEQANGNPLLSRVERVAHDLSG